MLFLYIMFWLDNMLVFDIIFQRHDIILYRLTFICIKLFGSASTGFPKSCWINCSVMFSLAYSRTSTFYKARKASLTKRYEPMLTYIGHLPTQLLNKCLLPFQYMGKAHGNSKQHIYIIVEIWQFDIVCMSWWCGDSRYSTCIISCLYGFGTFHGQYMYTIKKDVLIYSQRESNAFHPGDHLGCFRSK